MFLVTVQPLCRCSSPVSESFLARRWTVPPAADWPNEADGVHCLPLDGAARARRRRRSGSKGTARAPPFNTPLCRRRLSRTVAEKARRRVPGTGKASVGPLRRATLALASSGSCASPAPAAALSRSGDARSGGLEVSRKLQRVGDSRVRFVSTERLAPGRVLRAAPTQRRPARSIECCGARSAASIKSAARGWKWPPAGKSGSSRRQPKWIAAKCRSRSGSRDRP